jgi:4-amino-4-deoxy-L-arabinose transferase-like glycosyltransferase
MAGGFEERGEGGGRAAWHGFVRRHELALLAAVLAFAALVRVVRWQVTAVMFNDGPAFLALAEAIASGDWGFALGHPFHPLYPAAIAALEPIVRDRETAAVSVSVLSGTAAVASLYLFVRVLLGPLHAWVAAGLLAVHPRAIEYSGDIQSEGLYLALFLAAAALLWRGLREARTGSAFGGGVLAGAAYLTRPEGLGLVIVAIGIAGLRLLRGRWGARRAIGWSAAAVAGVVLLTAPYVAWLRAEEGVWMVSQKKSLAVMVGVAERPSSGPDPLAAERLAPPEAPLRDEAAREQDDDEDAWSFAPPGWSLAEVPSSLGEVLRTHFRAIRYQMLLLLVAGWVLRPSRRPGPAGSFVIVSVGAYMTLLLLLDLNVGYVSSRHAFPPMVLTFGYAADGLLRSAAWLARGPVVTRASRHAAIAGAMIFALMAGIGLAKALRPDRVDSLGERRAAEWLREQELSVDAVAVRKRRTAYYASAPYVLLPSAAHPYGLRERGASHLIIAEEDVSRYPKLDTLSLPYARLLHRVEVDGRAVLVYELGPFEEP